MKKKVEKDLTGLTIEVKKQHRKVLDGIENDLKVAARLMEQGAIKKQIASETLWTTLRKLYPEINNYQCSYGEGEILIRYNLDDLETMKDDIKKKGWIV